MKKKKPVLYIDQYGQKVWARTITELREQVPGRVSKMYVDRGDKVFHTGYVVGQRWFTAFAPVEKQASF